MNVFDYLPLEVVRRVLKMSASSKVRGHAIDVGAHVGAFSAELLEKVALRDSRLTVVRAAVGGLPGHGHLH